MADPVCRVPVLRHDAAEDVDSRNYWAAPIWNASRHCRDLRQRVLLHPVAAGRFQISLINKHDIPKYSIYTRAPHIHHIGNTLNEEPCYLQQYLLE